MNKNELDEIQSDLLYFIYNYIDTYNKEKYFRINVKRYKDRNRTMLKC
jgi:hypothetical protein